MAGTPFTLTGGSGRAGHGGSLPVGGAAGPRRVRGQQRAALRAVSVLSAAAPRLVQRDARRTRTWCCASTKREFGEPMVVPIAFRAVETMVPRVLASDPRLNVRPGHPDFEGDELDVKVHARAPRPAGEAAARAAGSVKSGAIYGIGGGKCYWKQDYREKRSLVELEGGRFVTVTRTASRASSASWCTTIRAFECIDMFDGFWDPYAYDTGRRCATSFIARGATISTSGRWSSARSGGPRRTIRVPVDARGHAQGVGQHERAIRRGSSVSAISWRSRRAAAGQARRRMHEVWEFHDGDRVITLLDGVMPVQIGENPYWHRRIPFLFWRPRRVPHEFVGIGVIEPIEMLHDELMEMRGSRARQRACWRCSGCSRTSTGSWIRRSEVRARARDPGQRRPARAAVSDRDPDIPNSGYQEEDRLLAELERASALSDRIRCR
jgi:hypothetical protein